ncbi:hypothetical protein KP220_000493 [Salmonella enterica]|uniref:Uncharacterized protein n=1 Tax=Salmonella enterica TaxID=28901 RepID=A0A743S4I3_SALER|nr:hypothetical protein [Salmonella enterica]HAF2095731.1 hypothetical protein [Salmonella enterica]
MSQYKIEEKIDYAPDGTVISRQWEVYHQDGRLVKGGLESEEMAQHTVKIFEERAELDKLKISDNHRNASKP